MGSLFSSEGTSWKCQGTVSFPGLKLLLMTVFTDFELNNLYKYCIE